MRLIGHSEFGPNYIPLQNKNLCFENSLDINHWLEQWYLNYKNCYENFKNRKNIYFICYEELCSSKDYWIKILQILDIKDKYDFEFKESKKNAQLVIDNDIKNKAISEYNKLTASFI